MTATAIRCTGRAQVMLIILVTGLGAINAANLYSRLVDEPVGSTIAGLNVRIEAQARAVAGVGHRIDEINAVMAKLAERRATVPVDAIAAKARERMIAERLKSAVPGSIGERVHGNNSDKIVDALREAGSRITREAN